MPFGAHDRVHAVEFELMHNSKPAGHIGPAGFIAGAGFEPATFGL
jgi:hypothetical protein